MTVLASSFRANPFSMSKINSLSFFFFMVFFFSCKEKESEVPVAWSLSPSGEKIQLPLDDSTSNVSIGLEYFRGDKPLLFNANQNSNSLQIFNLESQSLEKELVFAREGDQSARLSHFHVHNLDSIFIFPEMSPFIILSDTSGKVKNRIRFQLPEGYPMIFVHNSYYVTPPHINHKELIVKVRTDRRITDFTQVKLDSVALFAAINLETGTTRMLQQRFPGDYLSNGYKQLEFSAVNLPDRSVVSFMGDHRVYQSTPESRAWKAKEAPSQFLDATMPTFAKDVDGRGFNTYFFAKSRYESLIFDPFRKVYYRFAYPTVAVETDDELRALRTSPREFVVMVLDEELNVLTERKFEAGTYLPSNFFVGEKGLYLSVSHPDNPNNREDLLAFELIELKN